MKAGNVAAALGRGLVAGLAGTVAITISQAIEMKLRHRPPSTTPADAVDKVLGVEPVDEKKKLQFANLVHFAYGTAWGGVRGLLDVLGLKGPAAMGVHYAAVETAAMTMLPALKVAPPVNKWGTKEIAIESWHHLVYAVAAGLTYACLKANSEPERRRSNWLDM